MGAWGFHSEQCPFGIIGVDGRRMLRFLQTHKLDTVLKHVTVPLENTPRAFVNHPQSPYFYIIQSDNNTLSAHNRKLLTAQQNSNGDTNGESKAEELPPKEFGYPKAK